ncbi:MAG: class I SAM-dependent methyltransferase [Desulfomonilaceae bacterium]
METHEYKTMFDMETDYWWYVGLHQLVLHFLSQANTRKGRLEILDAGCGTGQLMKLCQAFGLEPIGLDFSREALRFSGVRGLRTLVQGSISEIPFRSAQFDVVVSLDVADCLEGDEIRGTFCEMHRVLRRGGYLILNLPAYGSLRSQHDLAQHILHRFSADELSTILSDAGFQLNLCTYRNTFLFPAAAVVRLLKRRSAARQDTLRSDLKPLPHPINAALSRVLALENSLIKAGLHLPFGLSVFCVAKKLA